jgi:hypothetical protein
MLDASLHQLINFRAQIYKNISYRADACFELMDALASNVTARTPVQLSLNDAHRRGYTSQTDALDNFHKGGEEQACEQLQILLSLREPCISRPFHLLGVDCTPAPRQKSPTLADRTVIYIPNPVPGNKPIGIGHKYSLASLLPEKSAVSPSPWTLPLQINRVESQDDETLVGATQLNKIIQEIQCKEPGKLCVVVADSGYSKPEYIDAMHGPENKHAQNTVTIIRARSNRVVNHPPTEKRSVYGNLRGHERWYGKEFRMKEKSTWGDPINTFDFTMTTRSGKECVVQIMAWENMLMRQKNGVPMNEHPFTLVRISVSVNGKNIFHKPMWLMVFGGRRVELLLEAVYRAYMQRYDMEHGFRMQKRNLLADKLQTPSVQHEENWWSIAMLTYAMMYASRKSVEKCYYPWEKYAPDVSAKEKIASPTQTQRGFYKLLMQIGTPARAPKPRGNPLGRKKGENQPKRTHPPLIIKNKKAQLSVLSPP